MLPGVAPWTGAQPLFSRERVWIREPVRNVPYCGNYAGSELSIRPQYCEAVLVTQAGIRPPRGHEAEWRLSRVNDSQLSGIGQKCLMLIAFAVTALGVLIAAFRFLRAYRISSCGAADAIPVPAVSSAIEAVKPHDKPEAPLTCAIEARQVNPISPEAFYLSPTKALEGHPATPDPVAIDDLDALFPSKDESVSAPGVSVSLDLSCSSHCQTAKIPIYGIATDSDEWDFIRMDATGNVDVQQFN
ncbi:hypothetical protein BJX99DRAFT_255415 [Aspergillus californicus]